MFLIIAIIPPNPQVIITSDTSEARVGCHEIRGRSEHLRKGQQIWLVVHPSQGDNFPQDGPAIGLGSGEWSSTACFPDPGTFDVLAVLTETRSAQTVFAVYRDMCKETRSCPAISELWEGAVVKNRVTTKVTRIVFEAEAGRGDGQVMTRSAASGGQTVLLRDGESRTLSVKVPERAQYGLNVRYSNDNSGPLEVVDVSVDGALVGQFSPKDTGDRGEGWNIFEESEVIGPLDLPPGDHQLTLAIRDGDGFGVELDVARFE